MTKRYIAKFDGKIVGKRTTDRTYTHAVVVQRVEKHAHQRAYLYAATTTDRDNYQYYLAIAEGRRPAKPEDVTAAAVKVDGGFGAYVARVQEKEIAWFEAQKAKGYFEPFVVSWAGRPDLARKAGAQYQGPAIVLVALAEAEIAPSKKG